MTARLFLSLLALLLAGFAAADPLPVHWQSMLDGSAQQSWHAVQSTPGQWQDHPQPLIVRGFTRGTVWLRAEVPPTQQGKLFLELANPPLDQVTLYVEHGQGRNEVFASGTAMAWHPLQPRYHHLLFPLQQAAGETLTLWLAIRGNESVMVRPRLFTEEGFLLQAQSDRLWLGGYIGIFVGLGLYSLMVYMATRDRSFLNYVLFVSGNGLLQINLFGVFHELLFWQYPRVFLLTRTLFPVLAFLGFIQFSRQFLVLQQNSPRLDRMFRVFAGAALALLPLYLIGGNYWTIQLESLIGMTLGVLGEVAGVLCWWRGFRPARFYLLAQSLLLAGGVMFVLTSFGVLPPSSVTLYGMQIGAAVETILIAFSLADKINIMQRERIQAQTNALFSEQQLVESLRQSERLLEHRVQERTAQLETALEQQQLQAQQLLQANERLQALDSEKNAFLAIAAHDLKNPTSMIIGYANLMTERWHSWDDGRRLGKLAQIRDLAQRTFDIIRNLLDLDAIESGNYQLRPVNLEIHGACATLIEEYRDRAEIKGIRLHLLGERELHAHVDKGAFYEIIDNLLSNAIKYSPHQREVSILLAATAAEVELSISDQGPGLSAADQSKLFQKFTRLSARPTGGEHSTGLGLSIVKRILEASGGSIHCTSQLGHGSSFVVRLPRWQATAAADTD